MRFVLALGLSIILSAPSDAAAVHRPKGAAVHLRARAHLMMPPEPGAAPPARFSVPGWTNEQTEQWIDNATSCWSCG